MKLTPELFILLVIISASCRADKVDEKRINATVIVTNPWKNVDAGYGKNVIVSYDTNGFILPESSTQHVYRIFVGDISRAPTQKEVRWGYLARQIEALEFEIWMLDPERPYYKTNEYGKKLDAMCKGTLGLIVRHSNNSGPSIHLGNGAGTINGIVTFK